MRIYRATRACSACDDALVTLGRLLMHAGWTLAFPGAGQGAAGKRVAAYALAGAGLVAALAVTVTVFALYVAIALRVASAIDAVVRLRKVEGEDRNTPLNASVIGVLGFLYFMFATERYAIPTPSMTPTIAVGDTVYIEKLTKHWSLPSRGEVIVFEHPCEKRTHIKRVVGIEGDSIEMRCGRLYVNGEVVARDGDRETLGGHTYRLGPAGADFPGEVLRACPGKTDQPAGHIVPTGTPATACAPHRQFMVPEASVFVLGDNRAESNDSRNWGVVPVGSVIGRAIGVAWPLAHAGAVD